MEYSKKFLPLIIGIAMGSGVFLGSKLDFDDPATELFSYNSKKEKLNRLIDYIDYEYVDEINTDSIVDVTVNRILENLDPHSTYISPEELEGITENMQGDFIGIGVSYYTYRDTVSVLNTILGGPSEKAGIQAGDRILMADNDTLYGSDIHENQLNTKLRGELNSKVKLKVYRKNKGVFDVMVTRGKVPIESIDASYMITSSMGYIKIDRFAETTFTEFKKALRQLKRNGATSMIIDLRDNGGGFIAPALKIADEFLEDDKLIMFTKNKKGTIENNFSTSTGIFEKGDLYILLNENSASASEILAGAIQDNDRGTIVGRRSYGKGLVQREMSLGDGSAVRLTISRYYTPTGRSIQKPYKKNGNKEYFNEYLERYRNGELQSADSIQVADSLKFKTTGGKIVYGGGGIIPDIFVGKEGTRAAETLSYMVRNGFMGRYVFEQIDKDRDKFKRWSREDFIDDYQVPNDLANGFMTYAKNVGIDMKLVNHEELLKKFLKATIARQLFDNSTYEQILNKEDSMVNKVLSLYQNS